MKFSFGKKKLNLVSKNSHFTSENISDCQALTRMSFSEKNFQTKHNVTKRRFFTQKNDKMSEVKLQFFFKAFRRLNYVKYKETLVKVFLKMILSFLKNDF
jgi:hypothetical protein